MVRSIQPLQAANCQLGGERKRGLPEVGAEDFQRDVIGCHQSVLEWKECDCEMVTQDLHLSVTGSSDRLGPRALYPYRCRLGARERYRQE